MKNKRFPKAGFVLVNLLIIENLVINLQLYIVDETV